MSKSLAGRVNVGSTLNKDTDGLIETLEAVPGGGFKPVGKANDLAAFLQEAGLLSLYDALIAESLPDLMRRAGDEAGFGLWLKEYLGMASVADRRLLTNALTRARDKK